jgi:pilus assembly protein CpaE
MAPPVQIRLLVVEDVPQVAQYIRGLLAAQTAIKLVDIVTDGSRALAQARELRPDVVIVDWLMQGKLRGDRVVAALDDAEPTLPVIALTVPQHPLQRDAKGVAGILAMPFSGFDLVNKVKEVHAAGIEATRSARNRMIAVFAPKGGVGKTTIAFNLAVAIGQRGVKTCLLDGSLQFGDLRGLLKVPADAASLLDLPTDRIGESDLADVLWRDPSGIDILLAPPRVELAEMISVRDIEKIVSLLRRVYECVIVDLPSVLSDISLAVLDAADVILQIVTYDHTTIRNTRAVTEAFRAIGYPADKVQYLVNRSDSGGGLTADDLRRAFGREPEHHVVSDGRLVVASNNDGVPFVLHDPDAPISRDVARLASALVFAPEPAPAGRR